MVAEIKDKGNQSMLEINSGIIDQKRAKIQFLLDNAADIDERELAEALLVGYDSGEIDVLTDAATGETLFTLKSAN